MQGEYAAPGGCRTMSISYRKKLIKVWNKTHFDRESKAKSLQISFNPPEPPDSYGNIKEGSIIIGIVQKDNSQGFQLSTGDCGDLIDVLTSVRKSLINQSVKLSQEVEK